MSKRKKQFQEKPQPEEKTNNKIKLMLLNAVNCSVYTW